MKIGYRIRQLRKAKSLTTVQLADLTNTTQQTISNYETDKSEPNLDMLESICNALGVTLSGFFLLDNIDSLPVDAKVQLRLQISQIQQLHLSQLTIYKNFIKEYIAFNNVIEKAFKDIYEKTSSIEILDLFDIEDITLTFAGKPITTEEKTKIIKSCRDVIFSEDNDTNE